MDNFNPDQNPFSAITQKLVGAAQAQQAPQQQAPMQGQPQGKVPPQPTDVLQQGVNPDASRPLIGALNLMHKFIESATTPEDIQMSRMIIQLMTKMIEKDQASQHEAVQGQLDNAPQEMSAPAA